MEPTDFKNGLLLLAVFAINLVLIGFFMRMMAAIGKFIGVERLIDWIIAKFGKKINDEEIDEEADHESRSKT